MENNLLSPIFVLENESELMTFSEALAKGRKSREAFSIVHSKTGEVMYTVEEIRNQLVHTFTSQSIRYLSL